jgi:RNA recognition motif-containing protein
MTKKIYVGNLAFQTTENDLNDLFAPYGAVESSPSSRIAKRAAPRVSVLYRWMTRRRKKAISELNGREHGGRALTVNEARPMV